MPANECSDRAFAAYCNESRNRSIPISLGGCRVLACAGRDQRVMIGGCPCVVHGLRAAQPGEGDAFTSPQPGKRWATGGQPCGGGDRSVHWLLLAPLNAARSSGRRDTTRQARDESPRRPRRDHQSAATSSRSHRRHGACSAVLRCAAFSRSAAHRSKRRAGCLRPSVAVCVEHRAPIQHARLLPRECVRRLRPRTELASRRAACAMRLHTLRACRCVDPVLPPSPYRAARSRSASRAPCALTGLWAVRRHNA